MYTFHPYRLKLSTPLRLAGGGRLDERCGLLIYNCSTGGWGDAAPLTGFSRESLKTLLDVCKIDPGALARFPSARFAYECAARPVGLRVSGVRVNFLWFPDMEPLEGLLQRLGEAVSPCVKVKLGPEPDLTNVLELVRCVPTVRLRLDSNRRWDVDTVCNVYRALPKSCLEYVEEPFEDPAQYKVAWSRCPVPVALDESLLTGVPQDVAEHPGVKAFVLKPTLMGDTSDREPWIKLARETGKSVVWSACFESGVGLWHLASLAEQAGDTASGLDTGRVFLEDLVEPRPLPVNGVLGCEHWKVLDSVKKLYNA